MVLFYKRKTKNIFDKQIKPVDNIVEVAVKTKEETKEKEGSGFSDIYEDKTLRRTQKNNPLNDEKSEKKGVNKLKKFISLKI